MEDRNPMGQLAIIFAICLAGEGICALLPFNFPSSVLSMLLMAGFLTLGLLKEPHIQQVSDFLMKNMGIFYVPPCIGIIHYAELIADQLIPFLLVAALTTPIVYAVTGWTVQLMMKKSKKKEEDDPC